MARRRTGSPPMRRAASTGSAGGPISASASGAPCARTTAPDGTAWDYFPHDHARSRAYRWGEDGLGGHLRPPPAPLLRPGAVERARPDPQGAPVRPDRQRGQPRRGRQGVLLLPRLDADALLHDASSTSTRRPSSRTRGWSRRTAGAAAARRSSSCSTPASSTTTATSTSSSSTPRPDAEDILIRITVDNRGPDGGAAAPAADRLVPQHLVVGRRTRVARAPARSRRRRRLARHRACATSTTAQRWLLLRGRPAAALHRERDQRTPVCGAAEQRIALRQGRHRRPRRARRGRRR